MGLDSHYYFLASPYNGSPEEKKYRYEISHKIVAFFLERHISLFAPILYNQTIIENFPDISQKERFSLLMPMNLDFLMQSSGVILIKLDGWDDSLGIQQYLHIIQQNKKPLYELTPQDLNSQLLQLAEKLSE